MKPCWCILSCACRQPQSAEPEGNAYSLRNSQVQNRLLGIQGVESLRNAIGVAVGSFKPMTPAENLALLKAELGRARTKFFVRRHAASLAVKAARDGLPDDLDALAVLFQSWQEAVSELLAVEAQVEQAEKEVKAND